MQQYTVASTTDTPEDVYAAAGRKAPRADSEPVVAVSEEAQPAVESEKEVSPAQTKPAASETASENQEETERKDEEPKTPYQRRIDKLIRAGHDKDRQIEELTSRVDALLNKFSGKDAETEEAPTQAAPQEKPKRDNFLDEESYFEALADWKVEQRLQAKEQQEAQQTQQDAWNKAVHEYNDRLFEARERYDDFDEVLDSAGQIQIPTYLQESVVWSPVGPDIAYYLAKNPDEAKAIFSDVPVRAIARIGAIEKALADRESNPADSKQNVTVQKNPGSPARKPITPMKPVGGSVKATVAPDEMSYSDFRKWRDEQERKRYRR